MARDKLYFPLLVLYLTLKIRGKMAGNRQMARFSYNPHIFHALLHRGVAQKAKKAHEAKWQAMTMKGMRIEAIRRFLTFAVSFFMLRPSALG